MNKPNENSSNGTNSMDDVGRLIHLAGARELVQEERFERSRQKVHMHWQQVVAANRRQRRPRKYNVMAVAASIAAVVSVSLLLWNMTYVPARNSLASVDRVLGEVMIADEVAGKGSVIGANSSITTGEHGRIALRMSGGQSLRIDTQSHVVVHSPDRISLESGAIYIDTALAAGESPILVSTPLGMAQDIGTQFQVRVSGMMLVVGVRQGLVEVTQPGQQSLSVNKGSYIELATTGESEEHPLQPDDPAWDWIETVAPEFDIQGASLEQYLEWYARERGLVLVWEDDVSRSNARAALLKGSIAGTGLDESLTLVKRVAPFEHRISNDNLWVKVR